MTLTIQIPDELAATLQAEAEAEGLSPDSYVVQVLEKTLAKPSSQTEPVRRPFKSSYGILAKYGPAPSAEEINTARKELWGNFPGDK